MTHGPLQRLHDMLVGQEGFECHCDSPYSDGPCPALISAMARLRRRDITQLGLADRPIGPMDDDEDWGGY